MTPAERFTITLTILGMLTALLSTVLTVVIRATVKWTRTEDKLSTLVDEVRELIVNKDADHERLRSEARDRQARADREHVDMRERLTYLERRELAQRREADSGR